MSSLVDFAASGLVHLHTDAPLHSGAPSGNGPIPKFWTLVGFTPRHQENPNPLRSFLLSLYSSPPRPSTYCTRPTIVLTHAYSLLMDTWPLHKPSIRLPCVEPSHTRHAQFPLGAGTAGFPRVFVTGIRLWTTRIGYINLFQYWWRLSEQRRSSFAEGRVIYVIICLSCGLPPP